MNEKTLNVFKWIYGEYNEISLLFTYMYINWGSEFNIAYIQQTHNMFSVIQSAAEYLTFTNAK